MSYVRILVWNPQSMDQTELL